MHNQTAFSLIELLVTISIVSILAGLSIASYLEYKNVVYQEVALQHCSNLRKSLEGGIIADNGFTFFDTNRSMQFEPDGTFKCNTGCTGITEDKYFPANSHTKDVTANIVVSSGPQT